MFNSNTQPISSYYPSFEVICLACYIKDLYAIYPIVISHHARSFEELIISTYIILFVKEWGCQLLAVSDLVITREDSRSTAGVFILEMSFLGWLILDGWIRVDVVSVLLHVFFVYC